MPPKRNDAETGQLGASHLAEGLLRCWEPGCLQWGQMEGAEDKQECVAHFKARKGVLAGDSHLGFGDQIVQVLSASSHCTSFSKGAHCHLSQRGDLVE